jgi:hypothetical protein
MKIPFNAHRLPRDTLCAGFYKNMEWFIRINMNAPESPWFGRTVQDATRYINANLPMRKFPLAVPRSSVWRSLGS